MKQILRRAILAALALCMACACFACGGKSSPTPVSGETAPTQTEPPKETEQPTREPMTEIPAGMFKKDKAIQSYVVPDGVTKIGESAFEGCPNLASITIPASVTQIDAKAFKDCSALTEITLPEGLVSIGDRAFDGCSHLTSLALPDSLTEIGDRAFNACNSLKTVMFGTSLKQIGTRAFGDCISLTELTLPECTGVIGNEAFFGCSALETVILPASLKTIGYRTFELCESLRTVVISDGLETIDERAFAECASLETLLLPGTVRTFGKDVFLDTPLAAAIEALIPQKDVLDAAETRSDTDPLLPADGSVRIIPVDQSGELLGDLFYEMPMTVRTINAQEADYLLVRTKEDRLRSDYTGTAYDVITRVYLCAADGSSVQQIYYEVSYPPYSGYGVLSGTVSTGEMIWKEIKNIFE